MTDTSLGIRVRHTDDAQVALGQAGPFLRSKPAEHNLLLTLLGARAAAPRPGRYLWAEVGGEVVGMGFQSPLDFRMALSEMSADVSMALAGAVVGGPPALPGVFGPAGAAAAFAGHWSELSRRPARPTDGMRLYRLDQVVPPRGGEDGDLRMAGAADRATLLDLMSGFLTETGSGPGDPPADTVDRLLAEKSAWLWDVAGRPVTMVAASPPVAGVSRVAYVYTPPAGRGRGRAAAAVASLSGRLVARSLTPVLYTDLANPTSNGVYRKIGYRAIGELAIYALG